ncbi:hypothetical protein EBR43_11580 [bacterium]|nr:hypothetical protein [bacterium]
MRMTELYEENTNRSVIIDYYDRTYFVRCFDRGDFVKNVEFRSYQEAYDWGENWNLKYED